MNRSSPLELLHPDGNVSTALVLGSNCPENLFPERQIDSDQKIGLLVIAPSKNECKMAGWLEKAVHIVDQRLLGDGLCYVLAPLPWRLKLIRLVSKANFV